MTLLCVFWFLLSAFQKRSMFYMLLSPGFLESSIICSYRNQKQQPSLKQGIELVEGLLVPDLLQFEVTSRL